jgi:hypothetical protein
MRLGYVGENIVANFGQLTIKSLPALVNNSKAKLWDLAQAREGIQTGWFDARAAAAFELFVHYSPAEELEASEKQIQDINETFEELEAEADKLDVRCRRVTNPGQIAEHLLAVEA